MSQGFKFDEKHLSQIPALQLLINLGYTYLPPKVALQERQGKFSHVLLENILRSHLQKLNQINTKGNTYPFSEANITEAIQRLKNIHYSGLNKTNEDVYDLLTLGTSLEQTIDGNTKSYSLKYIDWKNWQNNVFHVTAEFRVERERSTETARPDIVLFVNGIPFVVIECKSPKIEVEQAISQTIRNQTEDYIPKLFTYTQILIATNRNAIQYATTGTVTKFWAVWKEKEIQDSLIHSHINRPIDRAVKDQLFQNDFAASRDYFDQLEAQGNREITEQDRAIVSLCCCDRILDLAYRFTVFDNGIRKIARYQQFFAVNKVLDRVKDFDQNGCRKGGVIWHTQGSGKSLTMVMMAKALALDPTISNPRIVLVTDRDDLDKQIKGTFANCGLEPERATTGQHLLDLIEAQKASIITTIVNKFAAAANKRNFADPSPNIFVLVDESHRTQYGSFHAQMKKIFPKACYIGFTGTPLMKKEKNTAQKFGGIIDEYTIRQAVEDKAVVPLLYEGRHSESEVNQTAIDTWFDRLCKGLTDKQKADLKKKYSRASALNKAEQIVYCRAFDISEHYRQNWQGTGFKAQLVAPDKKTALKYHEFLEDLGQVSSAVIISAPDNREGFDDPDQDEPDEAVQKFWKRMMKRYVSEEKYNEQLINSFKHGDDPEILIVVSKLLTGFDAPRNTVLYLTRPLKDLTLLQAIARVNRLYADEEKQAEKEFGYIVDYAGVLENLDEALATYGEWEEFEAGDLQQTVTNLQTEIDKLPQHHAALLDIFKTVQNSKDEEAYEKLLADEKLREDFYETLSRFSKTLAIALSSERFITETSDRIIQNYKHDLKRFQNLKASVKLRYADAIDFRDLEPKIQKLLDTHISATEITPLTGEVNIFDTDAFEATVASQKTSAAKADLIASATKKTIAVRMEEDPAFYRKFSDLLQQTIADFRVKRISETEYLKKSQQIWNSIVNRQSDDVPSILVGNADAIAFFGLLKPFIESGSVNVAQSSDRVAEAAGNYNVSSSEMPVTSAEQIAAEAAQAILEIIQNRSIVDWANNEEVQKDMMNQIDDYLYDVLLDQYKINLKPDEMDAIIERSLQLARNRPNLAR
jgi:type I restriction enzyme, R subunit